MNGPRVNAGQPERTVDRHSKPSARHMRQYSKCSSRNTWLRLACFQEQSNSRGQPCALPCMSVRPVRGGWPQEMFSALAGHRTAVVEEVAPMDTATGLGAVWAVGGTKPNGGLPRLGDPATRRCHHLRPTLPRFTAATDGRHRIKQRFQPSARSLSLWYPLKWGISGELGVVPIADTS